MQVDIKPFTESDVDFAVTQAKREQWATGRPYFDLHLKTDPAGAFVAWAGSTRVGMITATTFTASGWLSNLIVEPDYRSKGVGRKLMARGFDYLRGAGIGTIRLDGDPPGIPLYRSMGFAEEYESLRYRWTGTPSAATGPADEFTAQDLPGAAALDRRCFGDDRAGLLEIILGQTCDALVTKDGERLTGFLFVKQSSKGLQYGPCCAVGATEARTLFTAALARADSATVTLGIPAPNQRGVELLGQLGFEPLRPCLRMVWGSRNAVGEHECYFAITGGATG